MPLFRLGPEPIFPPPKLALPSGLLAVGGDLSVERLLAAYRLGIFPWYSDPDPILWWSPDPRLVLFPEELHVSRSLRKTLRKKPFEMTLDAAFDAVMAACGGVRECAGEETWITPEMKAAYGALHSAGFAHSIEVWKGGELVGGLYGVSLGRAFFGESMFSRVSDASKVAFVHLVTLLRGLSFDFIDCQVKTGHLMRFGARLVPRRRFLDMLQKALARESLAGSWQWMERLLPPEIENSDAT